MKSWTEIRKRAVDRTGGEAELDALLPAIADNPIPDMSDDRILSEFSKRVFQAGFNWKVVENKWSGFEEAFDNFAIARNAMMSDDDLDRHLQNAAIVRNAAKILTIRDNAIFLGDLAKEHGSAATLIGNWPTDDTIGLFELLKARGSRLGGMTGQYALRFMGYDAMILSKSVTAALNMAGVIDGAATSKGALKKAQEAFNAWHAESGESYTRISRTLAMSVPD